MHLVIIMAINGPKDYEARNVIPLSGKHKSMRNAKYANVQVELPIWRLCASCAAERQRSSNEKRQLHEYEETLDFHLWPAGKTR